MIAEIENQLAYIADKMLSEKCLEIQHIVELGTGERYIFKIRRSKYESKQ